MTSSFTSTNAAGDTLAPNQVSRVGKKAVAGATVGPGEPPWGVSASAWPWSQAYGRRGIMP